MNPEHCINMMQAPHKESLEILGLEAFFCVFYEVSKNLILPIWEHSGCSYRQNRLSYAVVLLCFQTKIFLLFCIANAILL